MNKFSPTHEIELTAHDGKRAVIPVQLVDGAAYTKFEWDSETQAGWGFDGEHWNFQGRALPDGYVEVTVRKLGMGPTARTGDVTRTHSFRATDAEWSRWTSLAERRGIAMADLIRQALDAVVAASTKTRRVRR